MTEDRAKCRWVAADKIELISAAVKPQKSRGLSRPAKATTRLLSTDVQKHFTRFSYQDEVPSGKGLKDLEVAGRNDPGQ
jgi:hypothetical protein